MTLTQLRENGTPTGEPVCLDAELLACYVDGRTTRAERSTVEAHLARCEGCYFVFSETVQAQPTQADAFLEASEDRNRWRRWISRLASGLAAAAALVITVQIFGPGFPRVDRPDLNVALDQLAAAMGAYRPLEPRLSGGFPHRPMEPVKRSVTSDQEAPLGVRQARVIVETGALRSGPGGDAQRALALMHLMTGRPQRAIEILAPIAATSSDAGLLTDTAAAYLARRHAGDLERALDVAERAVKLDPVRADAWFNLALAAEAMGRTARALEAWTVSLALDPSSGWADEARRHLEKLKTASVTRSER